MQDKLEHFPDGVEKVMLRPDTAGFQQELLRYCAESSNERFGTIEFAMGGNVSQSFRHTVMRDDLAGGKLPSGYFGGRRLVGDHDSGAQSERSDETFGLARELEA